jgi:hypothetical protein
MFGDLVVVAVVRSLFMMCLLLLPFCFLLSLVATKDDCHVGDWAGCVRGEGLLLVYGHHQRFAPLYLPSV